MSTACAVMMTWCDLWHLIPEVKVTSCFPVPVLPICSSLMLVYVTTSSFDTCSVWRCWRWRWMQICPNKTVVIGNKSVIHTSYSFVFPAERRMCSACIDPQGPVDMAPCVPAIPLPSWDWTQGEINPAPWRVRKQPPSDIYWWWGSAVPVMLPSIYLTRVGFSPGWVTPSLGLLFDMPSLPPLYWHGW